jgi:uncharacterized membrane protein YfcA
VLRLGPVSACGGAAGAILLLSTPSRTFEVIAPWLIAVASLVLLRRPKPGPAGPDEGERNGWAPRVGVFAVAVYVGYFGAAGGILMFAVLASALRGSPARLNAVKNVLSALANAVAATGFALFGPVHWGAVAPLAAGFLLGGWVGPAIARRLPGQSLRWLAAVCGLAVAVKLGVDTYL